MNISKKVTALGRGLPREQVHTVRAAASKLMAGQREKLCCRHQKASAEQDSSLSSWGEGPWEIKEKMLTPGSEAT